MSKQGHKSSQSRFKHGCFILPVLVLGCMVLGACRQAGTGLMPELIQIDGSSTVYPIVEAMAEEFQISRQGAVNVTVGISGSGGGLKKFCRGELDIANASRPIELSELQLCQQHDVAFIELPIAYDAITIVVHPDNDWLDSINLQQLNTIWSPAAQRQLVNWHQLDEHYPSHPLNLYGAGPDSGTFDYFTAVVNGTERVSRGDYTASEDDNLLVRGVANDRYALGYFGHSYYQENREILKAVAVFNDQGEAVLPNAENVQSGVYRPLSRPMFIYVNAAALNKAGVQSFLAFFFEPRNREEIISWVGYVPLTQQTYEQVLQILSRRDLGSRFRAESGQVLSMAQALAQDHD